MEIHPGISAYKVSQHFEGVIQNRTVYNVIKDIKKRGNIDRKVGSGPKSNLDKPEVKRKLVKATVGKISKSYRFFGTKFKVDHQTVKKHLEKLGIRRKSRKCKPKVTEKQKIVQKTRLRKFKEKVKKKDNVQIVMDDETYFTLEGNEWQPKTYYYDGKKKIDPSVQYLEQEKYPK